MKKLSITLACLMASLPIEAAFGQVSSRSDVVGALTSGKGGQWGTWTTAQYCPPGSWAYSFGQKVESFQGPGDDTALNSIALYCSDRYGNPVGNYVTPHTGYWGSWAYNSCSRGAHMTLFMLQVEGGHPGDDTSANAVSFWCSNNIRIHASNAGPWGSWGPWRGGFITNAAICGLREKIESPQGAGDDTALNDVEFIWCRR
ncbi:MAG TPA: hypothetical protein V6D14_25140 [Coleofasciculaceae cyanobacterium]|jgi:hypothetical protein